MANNHNECNHKDLWNEIINDYDKKRQEYESFTRSRNPNIGYPHEVTQDPVWCYMDQNVFPILIPAMNSMLFKAKKWNALVECKKASRFNGLDHLSELLWNFNPRYPNRYKNYLDIFQIPFVIKYLKEHPRPIYCLSEVYSPNFAATLIQSFYRGYVVRKREDVQELRQFWKDYRKDKRNKKLL